jgi:hypothetical protein
MSGKLNKTGGMASREKQEGGKRLEERGKGMSKGARGRM